MITVINSNKTNVVLVNNGAPVNPPPPTVLINVYTSAVLGRVLTNRVALLWVGDGQP